MPDLDVATLRIGLVVVVLAALLLFYVVTYRSTRARYAALWCLALAAIVLGTALLLACGTAWQAVVLAPANALLVGGAAALYAGIRALDGLRTSPLLLGVPLLAAVATLADRPDEHPWAGDWAYLLLMAGTTGVTAVHLWSAGGSRARVRRSLAGAVAVESGFYVVRWVCFLTIGPQHPRYETFFGAAPTTLVNLAVLVAGVLVMSALATEQEVSDLRSRAARDGLTQLLNRAEFERRAGLALVRMKRNGIPGALVLADLDHFKTVNDSYGHEVGDRVLRAFADACRDVVRTTDLVARLGGEEFVLLLPGSSEQDAERVVRALRARLSAEPMPCGSRVVTASYGVVSTDAHRALPDAVAAADAALYRAKRAGRDRLGYADGADAAPGALVELA